MERIDVYLYGMTVYSTIHLLKGPYPEADTYQEILQTWNIPSGETAVGAVILSRLGLQVRIGGPHSGFKTQKPLVEHLARFGVDTGELVYDPAFEGLQELVLVDPQHRTVFGHYIRFLFGGERRWGPPNPDSIRAARVVAIDPFFGEDSLKAGEWCFQGGKPYVTLDCPPDGALHRSAAATVVSREYRKREHPGVEDRTLLSCYLQAGGGLTVFTSGAGEILYARPGGTVRTFPPYRVEVKGTLGAGDAFRAGVVFGLFMGFDDEKTVQFAAAAAALACARFPVVLDPPSLGEVEALMASKA